MFAEPLDFFANYGDYERVLSSVMIAVAMLGMGAALSPRDFAAVFVLWRAFAAGMGAQVLLVPIWAALCLALISGLPDGFAGVAGPDRTGLVIGIALLAALPGGSATNLFTFLGRGNVALSVSLTACTTLLCLVTTPLLVGLLVAHQVPGTIAIDAFQIVRDIALFLLVPVAVGMIIGPMMGTRRIQFTRIMVRISLGILVLIIIGSLGAGRLDFPRYGWLGPVAIILFCVGIQLIGRAAFRAAGLASADGFAALIEMTVKNVILALLVLTSMFPPDTATGTDEAAAAVRAARDGCTYAVLFYGAVSLVSGAILIAARRRHLTSGAG